MEQISIPSQKRRHQGGFASQSREHASVVWEGLRDRITQLYSVQDKSLAEVMRVMEVENKFVATYAYFIYNFE